ncbi:sensor histidine kinase [Pedobacter sp. PLR]|uniref:sensor histidine kinase n=1 Tax=Pedobacter sp. PLR TaxID=2994465 RepID=UPI002245ED17|nr:sensor histidine kinase [Pedobacter sp. PLR]MCX2451589.1 sensor histidine kinase [Pedobacter sp. PLR]
MQKKNVFNFPLIFEAMIWLFYVGFYKYSYLMEHANLPPVKNGYFPYPEIGLYAIVSTLYLIPYYRWAVPKLLYLRRYIVLFLLTLVTFLFITTYNNIAVSRIFLQFTENTPVGAFFRRESAGFFMDWNMIMTDFIAFLSIAFSRFSYQNERERYQIEKDHLELQLTMLKNQLQPHFLFNTLNSLYGMSLIGSKETPRFILLLSNMMQYILYDCDKPMVSTRGELEFMKGYFELEQKKYPDASVNLLIHEFTQDIEIPPMLLLPLIENSFKHGKHKVENNSSVHAEFMIRDHKLEFMIKNDKLSSMPFPTKKLPGGIGLVNIKKRLELYYPGRYELLLTENELSYSSKLTIAL